MSNSHTYYIGGERGGGAMGNWFSGQSVRFYWDLSKTLVGIEIVNGRRFGTCSGPDYVEISKFPKTIQLASVGLEKYLGSDVIVGLSFLAEGRSYEVGRSGTIFLKFERAVDAVFVGVKSGTLIDGLHIALPSPR